MASTGFDKPCFCGSGKKYEDCCFLREMEELEERDPSSTDAWLKEAMGKKRFNSLQEAQETLDRAVSDWNETSRDDFCGLSPAQMAGFLYDPFGEGSPARYNLELTDFPEAPFLRILKQILLGLSQGGLKMTAKGNLPPDFSRAVALHYYGEEGFREITRFGGFRKEEDWDEIHAVRLTAEMAGFVKKEKGRFRLARKAERVLSQGLNGKSFLDLFKAYTWKFSWAYRDRHPEMRIIQDSFLFTLFCLHRFGGEPKSGEFYADLFLRAFPLVLEEIPKNPYWSPAEDAKRCFSVRALERFASFFGFVSMRMRGRYEMRFPLDVKKESFLDSWISFKVG